MDPDWCKFAMFVNVDLMCVSVLCRQVFVFYILNF